MSLALVILAAAAAADAELATATREGRTGPRAAPVDALAVGRVIATLSERARLARRDDPDAPTFCLATWDPHKAADVRLHDAVRETLRGVGLTVTETLSPVGHREIPSALHVDFESLAIVAEVLKQAREDWLATAARAWTSQYGKDAAVVLEPGPYGEVVSFSAQPEHVPLWTLDDLPPGRAVYRSHADWADRPVVEVVAAALGELKLPAWTVPEVAAAWADVVPGGTVVPYRGVHVPGVGTRGVPALVFQSRGRSAEVAYAVEDVYVLSVEALVAKVRAEHPELAAPAPAEAESVEVADKAVEPEAPAQPPGPSAAPTPRRHQHGGQPRPR